MIQFNALYGENPNEPTIEWNTQPPPYHFKSITSPHNTSSVVSAIMVMINHHAIDNGDVDANPS